MNSVERTLRRERIAEGEQIYPRIVVAQSDKRDEKGKTINAPFSYEVDSINAKVMDSGRNSSAPDTEL